MALFSSVVLMVSLLALTAAGSVFLVNETRLSERSVSQLQAAGAAEVGIAHALDSWDPRNATRISEGLYLIDRSGLGLLVRLKPVAFPEAALVAGGTVSLGPGARVDGAIDSGATGTGLTGDLDLSRVASMADLTIPGGRYGSLPAAPADGVIHIEGDAELGGGRGSGVLLVDGNLTVTGPLTFNGVVLVRGELVVSGSAALSTHLSGSVVTLTGATGDSSLWVIYDKALVSNVLSRFGTPERLPSRSWTSLSQVG
ncbi:MAG TPA: hypothetical protein VJS20_12735 [Gemmatimonadales bacterium]|nr:hypothetical protein [Gemmatimonadales bacterium]